MALTVIQGADLSSRNTFGMRVSCRRLVEYGTEQDLRDYLAALPSEEPLFHIGGGSNLLFTKDFPGTVLHSCIKFIESLEGAAGEGSGGCCTPPGENSGLLKKASPDISATPATGEVLLRVGAGVVWDDLCAWCAERGLWGTENLSLIPGEVGAAAVQNIGAYGREVKDLIVRVECIDLKTGEKVVLENGDCRYGYRDSAFKNELKGKYAVTAVVLKVSEEYSPELDYGHVREAVIREYGSDEKLTPMMVRKVIIDTRKGKLPEPSEVGSAGSFFRNPYITENQYRTVESVAEREGLGPVPHFPVEGGLVKVQAAWMIDKCGWKGVRRGNAGVWDTQPLVLVNATGKASPDEILGLENEIIASVKNLFGVTLVPEVEHI